VRRQYTARAVARRTLDVYARCRAEKAGRSRPA
jgi:hypothetical protein